MFGVHPKKGFFFLSYNNSFELKKTPYELRFIVLQSQTKKKRKKAQNEKKKMIGGREQAMVGQINGEQPSVTYVKKILLFSFKFFFVVLNYIKYIYQYTVHIYRIYNILSRSFSPELEMEDWHKQQQ